ncbi:hypothetical protein [Hydrogenophaga sp.]|uniref:hypothetical protein n=1 Tax=Hydrogenophaga sp. TaxID=1904254 RepID=UPI002D1FB181|nr:hypothetical protein [Hydrogenophaga sp.]
MICFVLTWPQRTLKRLRKIPGFPPYQIWSYDALLRARKLPHATWIFTDFDRLSSWELELAAHACRELRGAGMRVLNDPALATGRFDLLRSLHGSGFNRFSVWRASESSSVDRFPVFLRTEAAHRGPLTDLIEDAAGLEREIARALEQGHPLRNLMVVEYCAQPLATGLFRKHAAFRVGDRIVNTLAVHDSHWAAKYGKHGVADESVYREELDNIGKDTHEAALMRAFDMARLDYGRADFALVDGSVQIYEINSNPTIGRTLEHPSPFRLESARLAEAWLVAAFHGIDSPPGPALRVADVLLLEQRRQDRFMLRSRWVI